MELRGPRGDKIRRTLKFGRCFSRLNVCGTRRRDSTDGSRSLTTSRRKCVDTAWPLKDLVVRFFFYARPRRRLLTQTTFCRLLPGSTHQGCLFQLFSVVAQPLLQGENATEPFGAAVVLKKTSGQTEVSDSTVSHGNVFRWMKTKY